MRYLILFLILILSGCTITPRNEYLEGTAFQIGLYIPFNGSVYGLQAFNYVSGKRIVSTTNNFPSIESEHIMTNSTFGCMDLTDINKTKINK